MENNVHDLFDKVNAEAAEDRKSRALKTSGGGGTSDGMDRVWEKLAEHDARFDRIEGELSNAKYWFVGTAAALVLSGLGLVYAAMSDTKATMSTALGAIQTVLAAKTSEPQPPTVIVIPQQHTRPIQPK